jgi:hypothetical protein
MSLPFLQHGQRRLFEDSLNLSQNLGLRSIMRKMAGRLTILELCFAFSFTATSSDVGMIFTAYNLRRILNILDKNLHQSLPIGYLKAFVFHFSSSQRPFKAILGLGFRGYWAHSALLTYCLDCGCAIKMGILEREMVVKWSY